MKYIQSLMLILATILIISCGNMNTDKGSDGNEAQAKQFTTATAAALAAKQDMLDAMDKVDFGINREQLRTSVPGTPVIKHDADWDALLKADSATTFDGIIGPEKVTMVPLMNAGNVITVISLINKGQQYSIGALGDKQISSELDMVRRADSAGMQAEIKIYEVPNITATIYAVEKNSTAVYYTSYNNSSIRQGMDAQTLMTMLKADAQRFQRMYGDDLKKGTLVR